MDTWQQRAGQIPRNDRDVLNRQSFYRSLCVSAGFQQRTYPLAGNGTPHEPTLDGGLRLPLELHLYAHRALTIVKEKVVGEISLRRDIAPAF